MSQSNCYCEEDYICLPCYNKELEEEYQAMQEYMNIEIADDAEELPF